MATRTVRQAKPSEDDINSLIRFFNLYELVSEKGDFDIDSLNKLDEDDEDKKLLAKYIVKHTDRCAIGPAGSFDYVRFFNDHINYVNCRWRRVVFGASAMVEAACDPTESHLAFYPGFELFHVAPEQ